jgi:hypothetical protein
MSYYIDRHYGHPGTSSRAGSANPSSDGTIHANAVDPGGIWTPLQKHFDPDTMSSLKANLEVAKIMKSPAQGAATTVWPAVAKDWERRGERYLGNCHVGQEAKVGEDGTVGSLENGFLRHAFDAEREERLWRDSLGMVRLG